MSHQQQDSTTAAAEEASVKQRETEMQAQIAALDLDKAQLSAELSSAHDCIQRLRDAEAKGVEQSGTGPDREAGDAQRQHQMAGKVVQVSEHTHLCRHASVNKHLVCAAMQVYMNACVYA